MNFSEKSGLPDVDCSMSFELPYNVLTIWKEKLDKSKDLEGVIFEIAKDFDDERYDLWLNEIENDNTAPTLWIFNTIKELGESVPANKSRLILPFLRTLSLKISLSELADIFNINIEVAKIWKSTGIDNLKKFMLNQ